MDATAQAGYKPGKDIFIALDAASSSFHENGKYNYNGQLIGADALIDVYKKMVAQFPVVPSRTGFYENDWDGWKKLTQALGAKVQMVGDDLFVTNVKRLKMGIDKKIANSILVKVNQIGALSETLDTISLAKKNKYTSIIFAPFRGNGRYHHRPSGGRDRSGADQDGIAFSHRPSGQVQRAFAYRRRARQQGCLRRFFVG